MDGLIVQANSLSVSFGQKYSSMKATTRKGMINPASQRVSGKMRSVRTRIPRTCSLFPMLSMVTTPLVTAQVLFTSLSLIRSGCTFISLFSIQETESQGNGSPADTLIIAGRGWQSIVVNTQRLNLAYRDSEQTVYKERLFTLPLVAEPGE